MLNGLRAAAARTNASAASTTAANAAKTATSTSPTTQSPAMPSDARLAGLGRRPISTVVAPTQMKDGKVTDPGHIQFQTTPEERAQTPGLQESYGHSRRTDLPATQRTRVSGTLPDGTPFNVPGLKGPAIDYGSDKTLPRNASTTVIDHGPLSPKQAAMLRDAGQQPLMPHYETSGAEEMNCVHAHVKMARKLGIDPGDVHKHARPQDLGKQMEGLKLDDSAGDKK